MIHHHQCTPMPPMHLLKRSVARRHRTDQLTYRVYRDLKKYGLDAEDIRVSFGVPKEIFKCFIKNHERVLGE